MYDRLWAPHGLVRYGVAPDHPEVKVRQFISSAVISPNDDTLRIASTSSTRLRVTRVFAFLEMSMSGAHQHLPYPIHSIFPFRHYSRLIVIYYSRQAALFPHSTHRYHHPLIAYLRFLLCIGTRDTLPIPLPHLLTSCRTSPSLGMGMFRSMLRECFLHHRQIWPNTICLNPY